MKKSLFIVLAALTLFLMPILVSAQSQTTQSLILQLQEQVKALQEQLKILQSEIKTTKTELELVKTELKFSRSLSRGAIGDEVKQLQEFLKQFPEIYTGPITGFFGPLTESAIKKFQEKQGIESIGVVGPKTRAKLNELLAEGAGSSGVIPPGLLTSPGIQKKIESIATTTPTPTGTTTTPSGTIPAVPATPATPATPSTGQGTTAIPATPATPATPAQPSTTTTTTISDTTPPIISNIQVSSITQTSATVSWTTDESASTEIKYSVTSPASATTTTTGTSNVTSHSINLAGLYPGSTYYYIVTSRDASNNTATSNEQTFATLTPPLPPPTSSNYIDLASLLPLRPWDVIMSGSDYIVTMGDDASHTGRLIRVTPEGNIATIASFNKRVFGVILSDSDFIVSDDSTNILRVSNNGTATTIASGVTASGFSSDIVLSGSDYIVTDYSNGRLLRVTPDGITSIISSNLRHANGVVADGTDFVVAAYGTTPTGTGKATLFRVTQGGSVSVIAELSGYSSVSITKMGSYYYVNNGNNLVRIATDGTISVVTSLSEGGQIISITNNGSDIITTNYSSARILKITPGLTQLQAKNLSAISQMINSLDEILKQLSQILK